MTSREFCYWLQGYFELLPITPEHPNDIKLTSDQVQIIKRHLSMVFQHEIDPSYPEAAALNQIHTPQNGNLDLKIRC